MGGIDIHDLEYSWLWRSGKSIHKLAKYVNRLNFVAAYVRSQYSVFTSWRSHYWQVGRVSILDWAESVLTSWRSQYSWVGGEGIDERWGRDSYTPAVIETKSTIADGSCARCYDRLCVSDTINVIANCCPFRYWSVDSLPIPYPSILCLLSQDCRACPSAYLRRKCPLCCDHVCTAWPTVG